MVAHERDSFLVLVVETFRAWRVSHPHGDFVLSRRHHEALVDAGMSIARDTCRRQIGMEDIPASKVKFDIDRGTTARA